MLRRITRNKQLTLPKEFMKRLYIKEGDYVSLECDGSAIKLKPVIINEFTETDYQKLAAKLDQLKKEPGKRYHDSPSARGHLKRLMR